MKLIDRDFYRIFCFAILSAAGLAQTATLRGVVTDSSGAVVAGARITLSGSTGNPDLTTSNNRGAYSFMGLMPGAFMVQAAAPQLASRQTKIDIVPGANTLNLQLGLASVTESVTVDADASQIGTDASSNASATVLRGSDLEALSDNPEDLMTDLQALAGPSAGPAGGSIYVDGFSGGELPPKESIREVRVNQNPFSPEFDKLGLGRIEILTKPGADHWRGNLNYNYATDAWNSRNPYSSLKAPLLLNEFENTLGGPLSKRMSLALDAYQNNVDNGSIVNAVTLQNQTPAPFFDIFKTLQKRTRVYPRIDYQLSESQTLSLRYSFTKGDIQGAGIGGFDLVSRGYHTRYTIHTIQAIETAVLSPGAINETRFQYYRNDFQTIPNSISPVIQVLGSFNDGGSSVGNSRDLQQDYELQNVTSMNRRSHTLRFGVRLRDYFEDNLSPQNFNGTFTFSGGLAPVLDANNQPVAGSLAQIDSIESYRRTLLFQKLGVSAAQIRALGGGASQFSISAGQPGVSASRLDAGLFLADDWRLRPNFTLNLGLRYEVQTNIHDPWGWAPRIGIAWAPGVGSQKTPKTVIRAGFGIFYDRFPLGNTIDALRYNGIVQQQYVVANPSFFPTLPSLASLTGTQATQVTQKVDPNLRAPYTLQSALTVERQLGASSFALTYTNSHGLHAFRSLAINNSGAFFLANSNPVFLMTSSGVYNQNQLTANFNSKVNKNVSLTGTYALNRARSNTDGLGTFPANPYNYAGEYGPAATDVHHRISLGGTINMRGNIRFSPLLSIQSGAPFDITTGSDLYGTTLFNGRPGIASNPGKAGLIQTAYGLLDPNPVPGEALLSRNYGRGPAQIMANLRVGKTIPFGPETGKAGTRRYNLTISMSARNLINHTNAGPIIGNITSPLFGLANRMAGNLNGEGFSENANNRRLELQTRLTF